MHVLRDSISRMLLLVMFALSIIHPALSQAASPVAELTMPSLEDERDTYRSWGWTWTADKEPDFAPEPTYTVSNPNIHGSTEGDDLWSYLMMYQRTGQQGYLDRAKGWARYFKDDFLQGVGTYQASFPADRSGYGGDHLYGWGLVDYYNFTGNAAYLAAAEAIAADAETRVSKIVPGQTKMASYGLRQWGRHLLLAARVAEANPSARWVALRDKLTDAWVNSPDWDSRGMYFLGSGSTDTQFGTGAYAEGLRIQAPYQIGVLTEALWQVYRVTGRADVKEKLVAMARFVSQYGLDPTHQYTGSRFGLKNGVIWHNYSATQPVTFWDPVYTTSLVNTLVVGYKLTGDRQLYDQAKIYFNRGTKGKYGSTTARLAADNVVHHFVDNEISYGYLKYNKGELQYTYLVFENGGNPTVLSADGSRPAAPKGLTVQ